MKNFLAKTGVALLVWMLCFAVLYWGDNSTKGLITVGALSALFEFGMWGVWVLING